MGILSRLFARPTAPAAIESRSLGQYSDGWGVGMVGGGGTRVDAGTIQGLAAATACIDLIAGSLASLPASIVIDTPDGRQPAPPSATAWALLARPSPHTNWAGWVSFSVASLLIHGNSVSYVGSDGRGAVTSLTPVPWPWLNPMVLPGVRGAVARLVFDVQNQATPEAMLLGLPARIASDDCLYIRGRGDTGIIGRSALSRAAPAISNALQLAATADALWANQMQPSGILSLETDTSPEIIRRIDAHITSRNGGSSAAGRPLIMGAGTTWTQLAISPGDAQLLESRVFSTQEICRLLGVPSVLVALGDTPPADLAPFVSAFAQLTLAPLVATIEGEFDFLLPPGQHLQLDMQGLLRGSWAASIGAMAVGVQSGFLSPNDARKWLGLQAHETGDALRAGSGVSYPADAKGVPSLGPKPGPGATAAETVLTHHGDGAP